jgi:hypothetical protein
MRILAVALIGGLALWAAGCGGSDGEDTGTATTGENMRLSQASWDAYVEARDSARAVNQKAVKTFSTCRSRMVTSENTEELQSCLTDSTSAVVSEGEKALDTLEGFEDEAGGACATALEELAGYLKLYVASVNALQSAAEEGDSASVETQIDQSAEALGKDREANAAFEAACKPLS